MDQAAAQAAAETAARRGYDGMAQHYADHVAAEMTTPSIVRSTIEVFANDVVRCGGGLVADVGCGPGHVTAFLADLGLDVVGIDIAPALLDIARAANPTIRFEIGELASLPLETGSAAAVIAKHSLIHTPAALIALVLEEFARVLRPGGSLYLSFFGAETPSTHGRSFDHAVTEAFEFDVDIVATLLGDAGFDEQLRIVRRPTKHERPLPHGTLVARRR